MKIKITVNHNDKPIIVTTQKGDEVIISIDSDFRLMDVEKIGYIDAELMSGEYKIEEW